MNKKQIEYTIELTNKSKCDYFCKNYHYSKTCPNSKYIFLIKENNKEVGVITFGKGANRNIGKPFNLEMNELYELTRCAFNNHHNYLSMYIAKCIKDIRKKEKNIKAIISYSDLRQEHYGILYKSANFKLHKETKMSGIEIYDNGVWRHQRNYWKEWLEKGKGLGLTFKSYCDSKYEIRKQSNKIRWVYYL